MTEKTEESLITELRQLREECRDRKKSAELAKKYPYDPDYEADENCLICNANLKSKVGCDIKNQMIEVLKELEDSQELPDEKMIKD